MSDFNSRLKACVVDAVESQKPKGSEIQVEGPTPLYPDTVVTASAVTQTIENPGRDWLDKIFGLDKPVKTIEEAAKLGRVKYEGIAISAVDHNLDPARNLREHPSNTTEVDVVVIKDMRIAGIPSNGDYTVYKRDFTQRFDISQKSGEGFSLQPQAEPANYPPGPPPPYAQEDVSASRRKIENCMNKKPLLKITP